MSRQSFRAAPRGQSLIERLSAFPVLGELSSASLERLAATVRSARFDADTPLLGPGSDVSVVPLVELGRVRVERTGADGRRLTLYEVMPGESCVLALSSALRDQPYPADAVAAAGTEILAIPAEALARLFDDEPGLRRFVLDLFAARLFDLMHLVREVRFERLEVRLARLLLRAATVSPGVLRPVELSHAELAARLGSAREVVSRSLASLRDAGLVELGRGRIDVRDAAGLAAMAHEAPST